MTDVLADHIDRPDQRHRCVLLDTRRLRCHDCKRTIILPAPAPTAPASNSPAPLHAPDRCHTHPGQVSGWCRFCRAEQLERQTEQHLFRPVADVAAGAAAGRAALADLAARRRTEETA